MRIRYTRGVANTPAGAQRDVSRLLSPCPRSLWGLRPRAPRTTRPRGLITR